ncbi:hypothetical protein BYT27DRAFT_7181530 [Phlegmacium glaucopus]|nr:hypothetical protein BYT27DRAFT_7181530 [Phlegmacium glaucopus]
MDLEDLEPMTLDLYDIALLLNYERASTEPRFRHTQLKEVADNITDFQIIKMVAPGWTEATVPKTGFVFERAKKELKNRDDPDLPTTMLPNPVPLKLRNLTPKQLETFYWQARDHDGCFRTVTLFQHFIDLFPPNTRVRVRTIGKGSPKVYTTVADNRYIMEMELIEPTSVTLSCVLSDRMTYITGAQDVMIHAVLGFASPGGGDVDTILDLASLQFGDIGRGYKGNGLFVLEPIDQYTARLEKYAKRNTFDQSRMSFRINKAPDDDWLQVVAKKTKERWDKRAIEPWCGYCGAPALTDQLLKRCAACKKAHYCDADHQRSAWTYHKHFCAEPKTK